MNTSLQWSSLCQVDPFLHLADDGRLQAMKIERVYGSKADDAEALESLSAAVEMTDNQAREAMVNVILNCVGDVPDVIPLSFSCDICIVSITSISICFILCD